MCSEWTACKAGCWPSGPSLLVVGLLVSTVFPSHTLQIQQQASKADGAAAAPAAAAAKPGERTAATKKGRKRGGVRARKQKDKKMAEA